jgi:hypothetical protein
MPKTPYADHLLNFCTNTFDKVILLSSYIPEPLDKSRFNRVKKLKLDWVKNNFEKKLTTIITNSRKSAYILPDQNNYLIDDTYKNIIDWRNHGGMAIFHKRYPITKKILNKITTKYIHPNKIILNNYIIKSGENS